MSRRDEEPVLNRFDAHLVFTAAMTVGGVLFFGVYAVVVAVTS